MTLHLTELAKGLLRAGDLTDSMSALLRKIEGNQDYTPVLISEFTRLEEAFSKEFIFEMGGNL